MKAAIAPQKLPVPIEILDQHGSVLGKTRSGKSSKLRVLVEGMISRDMPTCVLDPKGDWYGLKFGPDGKSEGFPVVIFGGQYADIQIDEKCGALVGKGEGVAIQPHAGRLRCWLQPKERELR